MSHHRCELAVEGMHCASCGLLIDEALEESDGVARATTDVRQGRTVVWFDTSRTTVASLAAVVDQLGYRARLVAEAGSM